MQLSVVQPIAPKWADIREAASVAYHYIVVKGNKPIVREYPNGILTAPGDNNKLSKSAPLPIWGLTLAPAGQSGYQLCPWRSKECEAACLGMTAGRSRFSNVQQARINKTRYLMEKPLSFWCEVLWDLQTRTRCGGNFAFRGNVLSDIPYEAVFPELLTIPKVCYDYTKSFARATVSLGWHHNYRLTLSYSGHNSMECAQFLNRGGNVAIVFPKGDLPKSFNGYEVIDGDASDARWADPFGVVVGLRAKGGIKDSVFVARGDRFSV